MNAHLGRQLIGLVAVLEEAGDVVEDGERDHHEHREPERDQFENDNLKLSPFESLNTSIRIRQINKRSNRTKSSFTKLKRPHAKRKISEEINATLEIDSYWPIKLVCPFSTIFNQLEF